MTPATNRYEPSTILNQIAYSEESAGLGPSLSRDIDDRNVFI
jgi:hypothetical protein